jgi:hypothetical protein
MDLTERMEDTHRQKNVEADKYRFRWLEWHLLGGVKMIRVYKTDTMATYEATKDSRKCMNDLNYGANAAYQIAILVSIVFKRRFSF